jgi:peroxiredoxin
MVSCDRCHRRFSSSEALEQHYKTRHPHAQIPTQLQNQLAEEGRLESRSKSATFIHKTSRTRLAVFVLVLIVAATVIGVVAFRSPPSGTTAVGVGTAAPDFSLPSTVGGTFTLSDYKGKANVLLFFNEGLACSPCLQQMQQLDQLNSQFTTMNIVPASITTDDMSNLAGWAGSSGPRNSMVLSDQSMSVSRSYDMLGNSMHPGMVDGHTFVLISPQGVVTMRKDYYPPSMYVSNDQLLSDIKQAMGT